MKRILTFFSFVLLGLNNLFSQPVWSPAAPSIGSPGLYTIPINYGIDRVGTVYIGIQNFNDPTNYYSSTVKLAALSGPSGTRIYTAVIPITAGNINTLLQTIATVYATNTTHTIYITAEAPTGVFVSLYAVRLTARTLPCPPISFLNALQEPQTCFNIGATARFLVSVDPDPMVSGILKGTTWDIDWGDSIKTSYISASDNDVPSLAMRTHTYSRNYSCNYVFSCVVKNPCGQTFNPQYVAAVHGRDIPDDGDGYLQIVNNATGSTTVQVCEGMINVITLRDNSRWNCQNPSAGSLTPVPNSDTRNIEWLYGQDPDGTIRNSITGTVTIAGLGNAPASSGRITPSPYGSTSQSQAITIPSSCVAGQTFRVCLKNWNKCNWTDPEYVYTYLDIVVVAGPSAPTVPNKTICAGGDRTLSVTSTPVGTITWYADAGLTTVLGTGTSYVPTQTAPGTYTFYVTDRSNTGLQCRSAATTVTLTINPKPNTPALSYPAKNDICYGVEPPESYTITATSTTPPSITGYQWFRDGVLLTGRTYDTIIITKPNETGSYTCSSVGVAPTFCLSDQSVAQYVTVHTLLNVTQPVDQTICQNQSAVFTANTTEIIANWQWEVSTDGGVTFSTVGASAPYSGFNTNTLTITTPPLSYNGYYYRVEMKTPNGQGGCRFKSQKAKLTIDGIPTANAGAPITRCSLTPLSPIYMTGATKGGTSSSVIWSGGAGLGTWTQNNDPALAYFTPSVASGSYTATLSVTGTAACGGVVATGTRLITWSQTPVAEAGVNFSRCDATPLASITMTGAFATGTYSTLSWSGGTGLGTWTQNADPALAVFTPTVTSGSFTATLTVTGKDGCLGTNATDTKLIEWGQAPVATAGPAFSRCDLSPFAAITMTGASSSGTYSSVTWSGGTGLGTWTQNANPALATFTPSVNNGSFTATLTLTGSGACTGTNSTSTRTIEWSYQATCNAGPDQSICATANAALAGSIGGSATSATWSGGTGTYNPDNTTLNAIYTPSAAERTIQTVTLTLTTNDPAGICPAATDNITISIGTLPTLASFVSPNDACFGDGPSYVNLNITGGAPPFTISYKLDGVVKPNITNYYPGTNASIGTLAIGVHTIELTQIKDGCNNILPGGGMPGPRSFTIYQKPVANPGTDQSVCGTLAANLTAVPTVGTGTWSMVSGPGTLTFTPSVNSAAVTATASTYGAYVVRWTEVNGGICTSSADINVSYEVAANASVAQNLCGTLSATLAGNTPAVGTGTWSKVSGPGTVSFSPNANSPGAVATVSAYGTYVLKWTISNICSTNSNVTITFEKAANAGTAQNLCSTFAATLAGNTPAVGTGTWTFFSGPGTVSFSPTANTSGATATVSAYGNYIFRWTINNGGFCNTAQDVAINYNTPGQVDQPANQALCNGSATTAITFTTTNVGGITTYSWTNSAPSIGLAASGTGNIASFAAINGGTSPVVATIVVTPTYSDGVINCPGPAKTFTITVNPTAQVNQPANQVVCNNGATAAISFTTGNTGGTTTYSWTNDTPGINLAVSGTGNIASFTAVNGGNSPVIATITVTPTFTNAALSCPGPSKSFTITVNPTGQVDQPANQVVCNNTGTTAVNFNTVNTGGTTTFSWTNDKPGIGLAVSGAGNIPAFTAVNTGTAPVTATIVVTPTFANGGTNCAGPAKTFMITVNPTGQVNQPSNQTVCNNTSTASVIFGTTNTGGSTTYAWTNSAPGIGIPPAGSGDILAFTAVNAGTTPVIATIVVTPTFTNGTASCPGPSKTFTITVNPTPTLSSSLVPADICSNTAFSYNPTSATAGTTFNWNRATVAGITPAGPTSGINNPNETLRNVTNMPIGVTYQYILSANSCSNIQNVIVNIKPEPVITPGQTGVICSDNALNYFITLDNFTNPGDNVTYTWPAPVLNPVDARFSGGSARLSASANNITDIFVNTMGADGTVTYSVTPHKNGCDGSPVNIVCTIHSEPVLDPGLNKTVCSNTPTGLILKEAVGSVIPTYYNIASVTLDAGLSADPGNAFISNPTAPANYLANDKFINITGVNKNVTYHVQPVLPPDCFGQFVDIVITIRPQPYIVPAQTKTVCSGIATGKEILLSPANVPAGSLFNWPAPTLSDASSQGTAGINVSADPAGTLHINDIIYNYSGAPITATYNITPTSAPGCSGTTIAVVITVNPEPIPMPVSGRDKICINEKNLVYNVTSVPGSTFHWTVPASIGTKTFDFNTNAIILDAAAAPGSGNISVYQTNSYSCDGDPSSMAVQVYAVPAPENITGPATVCANSTEVYSVTSRAGSVYSWTIPGGASIIGDPTAASVTVVFGNVGGNITVRETTIAGCITNHNPVTVIVKPLPTAILTGGGTICEGSSVSLFVTLTGTAPFTFTYAINGVSQAPVNTSSSPYTINATLAGTYTIVNVTDATGCTFSGFGSSVVTYYPKPTGIISGGATLCKGAGTTLTMTFTGTAPFTFTYTDGVTPLTVPNYPNAVYTVTVSPAVTSTYTLVSLTDGNTCPGALSGSAIVTINDPPAITLAGTNLTCNNDNSGAVNLTVTGNSPFGFAWTGPAGYTANTQNISGLSAGAYSVTVTDTKGCISTGSVTLTEPGPINATVASTNVVCFGAANGTITISGASGGSGAYEYTINGGAAWGSSGNFTGLNPGTYDVRIRDAVSISCGKTLNGALVITGPAALNATLTSTNIDCNGANNGTIIISGPGGGSGTYNYSVNGGLTWQGSGNFTGLLPGSYDVRIRDAVYITCSVTLNPALVITEPPLLNASVTSTNVSCFGLTDGSITVTGPIGGHGTYEYSINGGGSWQASGNFNGLAPGTYNVQIRDAAYTTCFRVLNGTLTISQPAVLKATVSSTLVSCNGLNDGTISITGPTGGSGAYQYTINGGTTWGASGLFSSLAPGSYDVRIRDAASTSCEIILNSGLTITEPPALSGTVGKTDITCFGAADGTILITNSLGGYGTYEYSIDGGIAWQALNSFSGLTSGTWDVRMRDKVKTSCIKILDPALIISEPAALGGTATGTNVTCFNSNDGTITVSGVSGGSGSYQYSINGGASWQSAGNFVSLSPGSYNVKMRDAVNPGCSLTINPALVITQPSVLSASATKTNISCFGAADGTITLSGAAGGYGTYEYTINGGATWQAPVNFTGLTAGFYNVKIRDAANPTCIITVNSSLSVSEPPVLNASLSKTNVTCFNASDGTIIISSPAGGYGTYEFTINGGTTWQSSGSFTGLGPGTYNVKMRDAAQTACETVLNGALVITQPGVLAATLTFTEVSCFGANNGTISITGASGGYGFYEYSTDGGTTWAGSGYFSNLSPATYNVKMRDATSPGCVLTLNPALTITQPPALGAVLAKTDVTCFGSSDGTITISAAAGGSGSYEYTITGGGSWQPSGNYSGLGPGNYNVQVRDAANPTCILVLNGSLSITQPSVLNATVTATMITCNGANDGIINITAPSGGYGTYQYSINGGTTWSVSGSFAGLVPATYDVRIRDAAKTSCVIILNNALKITEPAALSASLSYTNITCFGANNGSITISGVSGGYGIYEYTITGASGWQSSGSFTNLSPGTYDVEVRDKQQPACLKVLNAALVIAEPVILSATVTRTNVTCSGAGNGTIIISAPAGGSGTYGYTIDGGITWQPAGNFAGLVPGTYNVRIRDAANITCVIILDPAVIITQPSVLSATVSSTNVTCSGAADGSIFVTGAAGGYGTYEYTINGGATWQASGNFTGLGPGFYNVQIRDAANTGCFITLNGSLRITEPGALGATVTKSDITCNGAVDGKITSSLPTGGYGTYEYTINGGTSWQATGTYTGLSSGTYNVQIRDKAYSGCIAVLNPALSITEPAALTATFAGTNVTCNGAGDGTIQISGAAGGYGAYQYTVNGGTTWFSSGTFYFLIPGTYNIQLRDAANPLCKLILYPAYVITEPPVLGATVSSTNVTCAGSGDGIISITAPAGGSGTYGYSINGGGSWQVSGNYTGLVPGNYNVQIRDAANTGCIKVLNSSLTITQPAALNAVVTPTMVTCKGANDGKIVITSPTGGYGSYEYTVNGGTVWSASGNFISLTPGVYDVRIRDAASTGCVVILNSSLQITEPAILGATLQSTNITCFGATDGSINISFPSGGYGTYEYTINGGVLWLASGNFSGLSKGTYDVRIRDKANTSCEAVLNGALAINEPAVLAATVGFTNVTCSGASDGTITISAPSGGYGTYGYSVNGGSSWQSSGNFTSLPPGNYKVMIRDAGNPACQVILNPSLTITQPAVLTATVSSTDITCYGANDGIINLSLPSGGYGTYEYSVDGGAAWQASGNFTGLTPGFYNVQIRDAANTGCIKILNGSLRISEPGILAAVVMKTNVSCNGSNNGIINISGATGGTGTYEYSVNGGTTWQSSGTFPGLIPSTYNVQIRDAAHTGCVIVLEPTLVITEPPAITATVAKTDVSCNGANDGTISVNGATGGSGLYQFSINGGTTWQGINIFTNLSPATYNVKIRDAASASCIITLDPALVISQPGPLNAALSGTNVTCYNGNDGTITVSGATGGYGTYEFSINGGGSWQASGSFISLSPGNYNVMMRDAARVNCIRVLNNSFPVTQPGMLTATVTKSDITCNGANDGKINITTPAGGYGTYEYTIDGGTSWQASGSFAGLTPGIYNVKMRDAAFTGCISTLYPSLVIGEPSALLMSTTGDVVLKCFGNMDGSGTFYASGGTMPYSFSVETNTTGGVLAAPGFNSQSFFAAGTGSVIIKVTDANGCTAQSTITITQPAQLLPGSIQADQVICSGSNPATLTEATAPTGGPGAYSYQWQYSTDPGGPFINIPAATSGTYTPAPGANTTLYYRRMVSSGTCTYVYSNTVEILVNPLPIAVLSGGETICPAQSSKIKVDITAGTGPYTLDIENYPGLTVAGYVGGADIIVTPAVTTTYRLLRVRDSNGCEIVSPSANLIGSATITLMGLPSISVSPVSRTVCELGTTSFGVTASGSGITYQWYVNQGTGFIPVTDGGIYFGAASSTLMIFGAIEPMNGYIYHVVVSGCSMSVTSGDATLTVNTYPKITVQPHDTTVCLNNNGLFTAAATGTSINYKWQVNTTGTFTDVTDNTWFSGSSTPTLGVINAQPSFNNYIFRVKVTGLCGSPAYSNLVVLRVTSAPVVTASPVGRTVCENSGTASFTGGGSGPIDSLRWQVFTGGAWQDIYDDAIYSGTMSQQLTVTNAPVSYNGYQFRLVLKAACISSYTSAATLTVNSNPVVDFTAITPIKICGGVETVLNGNPAGGSGNYIQHTWTGDVGPLNDYFIQSPAFRSVIGGSYNLNYKVKDSNGCMANANLAVTVDAPDASFMANISNGCTPLTVIFTQSGAGFIKFWWDFNDGSPVDSVTANPVHVFNNSTGNTVEYHNVSLKVLSAGGCQATYSTGITVYPDIAATITPSDTIICSGRSLTFTTNPGANKYFWEYGDGISGYGSNVVTHLYTNLTTVPQYLTVKLTTTSVYNCFNIKTTTIKVMPMPVPQFTPVPGTQVYDPAGNTFTFTNNTNPGTWTWLWRFGDGATSAAQSPAHTYSGVGEYIVFLRASNANCSDSSTVKIYITPQPPVADFDSVGWGCMPHEVSLNNTTVNLSTPGTVSEWDFGDGSHSTNTNPSHIYTNSGIYRIKLTVTGPGGVSVKERIVQVYITPNSYFQVSPTYVFANDEAVRCFNLSSDADYFVWEFGDGDTSHLKDPYHKYTTEGTYDITLHAYSDNGCYHTWTLSPAVRVDPAGVLRFSTVFTPNKTGPIELSSLPEGGPEMDQFFFPPIREKVLNYKLQIFNRWGTLIFETHDINVPWNGYYKGKLCVQGVYVWFVEGKYANGKPFRKAGDITLLH